MNTTPRAHIRREKVSRYRGLTMTAMVGRGETKASTFCGAPVTDRDMLPADARDTMKHNAAGTFGLCLECWLSLAAYSATRAALMGV